MNAMQTWTWGLAALVAVPLSAQGTAQTQATARVPVTIRTVEAAGVKVHFQNLPWGPLTFATMESASDSFYNKRSWPFARLETSVPVTLDGTRVSPGNYALVFNPASVEHPAMSLEVLKVAPGEFFQAGNPMTRTPAGESVFKAPIAFDRASETVPALEVALGEAEGGLSLDVAYGDRRLSKKLVR